MKQLTNEKVKSQFENFSKNFKMDDATKIIDNLDELKNKFMNSDQLKGFLEDFTFLFSMIKDYYNKKYTEVPMYVIAGIGGTLLYVLSPVDLIPDFIPVVGFIDDAAIVAFCLKMVSMEVDKYKVWKENNS